MSVISCDSRQSGLLGWSGAGRSIGPEHTVPHRGTHQAAQRPGGQDVPGVLHNDAVRHRQW